MLNEGVFGFQGVEVWPEFIFEDEFRTGGRDTDDADSDKSLVFEQPIGSKVALLVGKGLQGLIVRDGGSTGVNQIEFVARGPYSRATESRREAYWWRICGNEVAEEIWMIPVAEERPSLGVRTSLNSLKSLLAEGSALDFR